MWITFIPTDSIIIQMGTWCENFRLKFEILYIFLFICFIKYSYFFISCWDTYKIVGTKLRFKYSQYLSYRSIYNFICNLLRLKHLMYTNKLLSSYIKHTALALRISNVEQMTLLWFTLSISETCEIYLVKIFLRNW